MDSRKDYDLQVFVFVKPRRTYNAGRLPPFFWVAFTAFRYSAPCCAEPGLVQLLTYLPTCPATCSHTNHSFSSGLILVVLECWGKEGGSGVAASYTCVQRLSNLEPCSFLLYRRHISGKGSERSGARILLLGTQEKDTAKLDPCLDV